MTVSILGPAKISSLLALAKRVRSVPGDLAECGVYHGGILRELADLCPDRPIYGFDTFKGMPAGAWTEGEFHGPGSFGDGPTARAMRSSLPANVRLVAGLFPASAQGLVDHRYAFVHIDFDLYESTRAAIEWFRPRMSAGGVMVFDDYLWPHCPGVERAIAESGLVGQQVMEYQWAAFV